MAGVDLATLTPAIDRWDMMGPVAVDIVTLRPNCMNEDV